jgi:hypothetical protein
MLDGFYFNSKDNAKWLKTSNDTSKSKKYNQKIMR